jgi:hypothetical protein
VKKKIRKLLKKGKCSRRYWKPWMYNFFREQVCIVALIMPMKFNFLGTIFESKEQNNDGSQEEESGEDLLINVCALGILRFFSFSRILSCAPISQSN